MGRPQVVTREGQKLNLKTNQPPPPPYHFNLFHCARGKFLRRARWGNSRVCVRRGKESKAAAAAVCFIIYCVFVRAAVDQRIIYSR